VLQAGIPIPGHPNAAHVLPETPPCGTRPAGVVLPPLQVLAAGLPESRQLLVPCQPSSVIFPTNDFLAILIN
jgi:hypothetical protein